MRKKIAILGIFLLMVYPTYSMLNTQLSVPAYYENIIAREYNRINGHNSYTSINFIMSQTLDGKSPLQKIQIMNDIKALRTAVDIAWKDAQNNGKRLWYWLYIFKDNEAIIDLLSQISEKISMKIRAFEWDMHWDITKAAWHTSHYITAFIIGIIALYASQDYLPDERPHSLQDMLSAPLYAGFDMTKLGIKHTLEWTAYLSKNFGQTTDSIKNWMFPS